MAVGQSGYAVTSTDGTNWTLASPVLSTDGKTALGMRSVVFSAGKFVAVGDNGVAATSTDGITWTPVATPLPAPPGGGLPNALVGLAVGSNGELVAVGNFGVVVTSRDGVHWTLRTTGRDDYFAGVAATPTGFFVGGSQRSVLVSTN